MQRLGLVERIHRPDAARVAFRDALLELLRFSPELVGSHPRGEPSGGWRENLADRAGSAAYCVDARSRHPSGRNSRYCGSDCCGGAGLPVVVPRRVGVGLRNGRVDRVGEVGVDFLARQVFERELLRSTPRRLAGETPASGLRAHMAEDILAEKLSEPGRGGLQGCSDSGLVRGGPTTDEGAVRQRVLVRGHAAKNERRNSSFRPGSTERQGADGELRAQRDRSDTLRRVAQKVTGEVAQRCVDLVAERRVLLVQRFQQNASRQRGEGRVRRGDDLLEPVIPHLALQRDELIEPDIKDVPGGTGRVGDRLRPLAQQHRRLLEGGILPQGRNGLFWGEPLVVGVVAGGGHRTDEPTVADLADGALRLGRRAEAFLAQDGLGDRVLALEPREVADSLIQDRHTLDAVTGLPHHVRLRQARERGRRQRTELVSQLAGLDARIAADDIPRQVHGDIVLQRLPDKLGLDGRIGALDRLRQHLRLLVLRSPGGVVDLRRGAQ